ncbi:MAG: hypothetical protein NC388_01595 [Clostridium sp.]|nr:hypothetical protein [Clostridium sp.]
MEIILIILMLFITLNSLFRLSFWPFVGRVAFALTAAAFVWWSTRYAVLQSKTQLTDYLTHKDLLQDMALLVTAESAICLAYCMGHLRDLPGNRPPRWLRLLGLYPGLLILPVLFMLLTQIIFTLTGTDFMLTAGCLAAATAVVLSLAPALVRRLFPTHDERLEIHFMLTLFVCAIGLISTVNGETVYAAAPATPRWQELVAAAVLILTLAAAGFAASRLKWRLKKYNK